MATLKGPTYGSGYATARMVCVYSEKATSDGSDLDADIYLETDNRVSDSSNSWSISGDLGSKSGSDKNIDHPSGGGRTLLGSVSKTVKRDADISCQISGISYIGTTVKATFTLEVKEVETKVPTISNIGSRSVSVTSFVADLISWTANGSISTTEVEYGKSKSSTTTKSSSGATDISCTGLEPGTTYYFRMRIKNQTGWSKQTDWDTVTTKTEEPGEPKSTWSIKNVTPISAETSGCSVSYNGGSQITAYQVQYNTSRSSTGASATSSASNPKMTGLKPDTTYYARIRARNSVGYGEYTDWKSFKTESGVYVRHDGSWKVAEVYVKYLGTWKKARAYIRKGGVWK